MATRPRAEKRQPSSNAVKSPAAPKLSQAVKLKTYKGIEVDGVMELLQAFVRQHANISQAAQVLNVTRAYLANILSGERAISPYIAGQLGYSLRTIYEPLPTKE